MNDFNLKQYLTENKLTIASKQLDEISSDLFKRATDISAGRGQDQRTNSMGKTFFNKFLNKELMGGNIIDITYLKPGSYEDVVIKIKDPSSNIKTIVYDVEEDEWRGINERGINEKITRADSRMLSLIAKHINPDTKYGNGATEFQIKGY